MGRYASIISAYDALAKGCIYELVNLAIMGSGNGLVPNRDHAIIWTNYASC